MNPTIVIFICLYLVLLVSYFHVEVKNNFKKRVLNKISLASLFFIFSLITYLFNYNFFSINLLLPIAITLAFLGDILLLFSFKMGGLSFLTSNIIFIIYQIIVLFSTNTNLYLFISSIAIVSILYLSYIYISKKIDFQYSNSKYSIFTYLAFVSLNGSLAIASLFNSLPNCLLYIGIILFMLSDYILMIYKFKYNNKRLLQANSGFYFIGLLLISLSLL